MISKLKNQALKNNLNVIREETKAFWTSRAKIPHYAPWHLENHAERIISVLEEISTKWKIRDKLDENWIFCLYSSVYLHDLGLQLFNANDQLKDIDLKDISNDQSKKIRTAHAKTSAKILKDYNTLKEKLKINDELINALEYCKKNGYLSVIGFMCEEHDIRIDRSRTNRRIKNQLEQQDKIIEEKKEPIIWNIDDGYEWLKNDWQKKLLLSLALLQTADTLDMTIERIPGETYQAKKNELMNGIRENIEPFCLLKAFSFYYVKGVEISSDRRIYIDYSIPSTAFRK